MNENEINVKLKEQLINFQRNEITEHLVYKKLSNSARGKNKDVLSKISSDELKHYSVWKKYTHMDVKPDLLKVFFYVAIVKLFSLTFAIKMMEKGEGGAQSSYRQLIKEFPEAYMVLEDEEKHERELIALIDEDKLNYISSMILGLNDALVELTGTLAGLSFAFQNTKLIGIAGLITGIAAALSMMSSEYLAKKSDRGDKNPLKASMYTGIAYIIAVVLLVIPFFIFQTFYFAIVLTLLIAAIVILVFTYFISITQEVPFFIRFLEMVAISFGVAGLSFLIGYGLRVVLHVDM
ncbi:MAG: VIT1/CCC1 transporter family protein [bacterium]